MLEKTDDVIHRRETQPTAAIVQLTFSPTCVLLVLPATFDVQDWVTTTETEAYYAANNFGLNGADVMQEMFKPLLDSLFASGYNFIELDQYV